MRALIAGGDTSDALKRH